MTQTQTIPTKEGVWEGALPFRKEYLLSLREMKSRLREELQEMQYLLNSTLLFETKERDRLQKYCTSLQNTISKLESCISLLEKNILRVEEGR